MISDAVREYFLEEERVSGRCCKQALVALEKEERADYQEAFRGFVLHRFLLWDTAEARQDDLLSLAEQSIRRTLALTQGDFAAAGVLMSCGGATTPAYKKVSLLFAVQKAFSIRFDPSVTAGLTTVSLLAGEVWRLSKEAHANVGSNEKPDETLRSIRAQFPFFARPSAPVYLDNAATMQIPLAVEQSFSRLCRQGCANARRGIYELSVSATDRYEEARQVVAQFLGALPQEIVFTSGATDALNKAALSISETLSEGDRVVVTQMEHHSNYLPWLRACEKSGAVFSVVPVSDRGELDRDALKALLAPPTKVLALAHVSNVLGTVNPIEDICREARKNGVLTVVDGAQGVRSEAVGVHELNCDFYAFSGHKLMSGIGIGVLYARSGLLERYSPPFLGGRYGRHCGQRQSDSSKGACRLGSRLSEPAGGAGTVIRPVLRPTDQVGIHPFQRGFPHPAYRGGAFFLSESVHFRTPAKAQRLSELSDPRLFPRRCRRRVE